MDKNSLRKLISDKLGISSSKKEFAFDVFLKKLSQTLEAGEALNIPGIGYFQLKNEPLLKGERIISRGRKKLSKSTIFFSPKVLHNKDESSLFLSFDVDAPQKDFTEFDENVFSIGIQKPLAPIFEEDESLAALQKSLESRIDEVIHDSEKLNNFDLFENYINQTNEDIDETAAEGNNLIDEIYEETVTEIPTEDAEEEINPEADKLPEPEIEEFETGFEKVEELTDEQIEETGEEEHEKNPFDELDQLKFDEEEVEKEEVNVEDEESGEVKEQTPPGEQIEDVEERNEIQDAEEKKQETKKSSAPSFEDLFENDDDLIDSILPGSEKDNLNQQIEIEDENEESIEWDWGDELNAEFQEEPEEENTEQTQDDEKPGENVELKEEENNLAEELEDNIADIKIDEEDLKIEDEPGEEPDLALAKGLSETFEDDINEDEEAEEVKEEIKEKKKEEVREEKKEIKKPSFKSYDWKTQSYGKSFWILLGVFILFTIFGLYYLLFWGGEKERPAETKIEQPPDTLITNNSAPEEVIAKVDTSEIIKSEPIKVAAVENSPVEEKTLYRKFENEARINSKIYSDGKRFMVQVSSFKTKNRAENDAARYQAKGHDAFIVEAYLPQLGGTWYRVRIGYFDTQKDAESFISKNNL